MTREIPLTKGYVARVDDADFEWLSQSKWFYDGVGYAARWNGALGRNETMHRVIVAAQPYRNVDHANRDRLDNRRANLRECWAWQNRANTPRPNKHGYRGVLAARNGKWRAAIKVAGRQTYVGGYHSSAEAAARSYDTAAKAHHGAFAVLNFPEESLDRAPVDPTALDLFEHTDTGPHTRA